MNTVPIVLCSLVLYLFFSAAAALNLNKRTKVIMNVISMGNCTDEPKLTPNYMRNMEVTVLDRDVILVNGELVITASAPKQKMDWAFDRCRNRDGTNCESFLRLPLPDLCFYLRAKGEFWSPLTEAIHPPLDCPDIKVGVYKVINGTYDAAKTMEFVSKIPNVMDYYWKQKMTFFVKKRLLFCVTYVGKIDVVRT